MQCHNVVADRREHPPHLVVAPLVQGQARMAQVQRLELRRQQRRGFRVQHQRAAGEQRALVATQFIGQRGEVDLRQLRLRRDDPVQQLAVVGQQQQAGGVAVEPPDRGERRVAQPEARRQQVVDDAPRVLARAGYADRLVEHHQQSGSRIQRLAVDPHVVVVEGIIRVKHLAGCIGDAPLAEHPLHLLAAAIPEVGDVPDQLHDRRASTILKPPCCATSRTCAKPSPSACS